MLSDTGGAAEPPVDLNVFTQNKRAVMLMHANLGPGKEQVPVVMVAIGGERQGPTWLPSLGTVLI